MRKGRNSSKKVGNHWFTETPVQRRSRFKIPRY